MTLERIVNQLIQFLSAHSLEEFSNPIVKITVVRFAAFLRLPLILVKETRDICFFKNSFLIDVQAFAPGSIGHSSFYTFTLQTKQMLAFI